MGVKCWTKHKGSGSRAHPLRRQTLQLLSKSSNAALAIQQGQISLCPSSLFVRFISRSTSQLQALSSKWAASHIWSWLEVYSSFFFFISQKEIKYTWLKMLLMFLPINLSTSSVGYWIQYTFLCSNKLFKFLNIKGSKRKKFNFHRRDWKWHHKIPLDWKKPFLKAISKALVLIFMFWREDMQRIMSNICKAGNVAE